MTTFTVYSPDRNTPDVFKVDLPKQPSYDQLKRILASWFLLPSEFEHVFINVKSRYPKSMFVDDAGRLIPLPHNPHVSNKDEFYPGDIFGIAVVVNRRVWY